MKLGAAEKTSSPIIIWKPILFALYAGNRTVGGRGLTGLLFAGGHGIGDDNGFLAFHLEHHRAVAGAQTAADACGFIHNSFHLNLRIYLAVADLSIFLCTHRLRYRS